MGGEMRGTGERASLEEQVGIAINCSGPNALDKVGALGFAGLELVAPLAIIGGGRWAANDRDKLAGQIAPLLVRAYAGADERSAREVVGLLPAWFDHVESLAPVQGAELRSRFAGRLLWEVLHDRCPACRGTGLQAKAGKRGRRVPTPFGSGRLVGCKACRGTKRSRVDIRHRAEALGISRDLYRAQGWTGLFAVAHRELRELRGRLHDPLRMAMSGRTIPA
jgi:hypothetical protein